MKRIFAILPILCIITLCLKPVPVKAAIATAPIAIISEAAYITEVVDFAAYAASKGVSVAAAGGGIALGFTAGEMGLIGTLTVIAGLAAGFNYGYYDYIEGSHATYPSAYQAAYIMLTRALDGDLAAQRVIYSVLEADPTQVEAGVLYDRALTIALARGFDPASTTLPSTLDISGFNLFDLDFTSKYMRWTSPDSYDSPAALYAFGASYLPEGGDLHMYTEFLPSVATTLSNGAVTQYTYGGQFSAPSSPFGGRWYHVADLPEDVIFACVTLPAPDGRSACGYIKLDVTPASTSFDDVFLSPQELTALGATCKTLTFGYSGGQLVPSITTLTGTSYAGPHAWSYRINENSNIFSSLSPTSLLFGGSVSTNVTPFSAAVFREALPLYTLEDGAFVYERTLGAVEESPFTKQIAVPDAVEDAVYKDKADLLGTVSDGAPDTAIATDTEGVALENQPVEDPPTPTPPPPPTGTDLNAALPVLPEVPDEIEDFTFDGIDISWLTNVLDCIPEDLIYWIFVPMGIVLACFIVSKIM